MLVLLVVIDWKGLARRRRIGRRTNRRSSKRSPFLSWRILTRRRRRRLIRATLRIDYAAQVHLEPAGGSSHGGKKRRQITTWTTKTASIKPDPGNRSTKHTNQPQLVSTTNSTRSGSGLTETASRTGKDEAIPERGSPVTCAAPGRLRPQRFQLSRSTSVRCFWDGLYKR